jgi:hypothetical protein
MGLEYAPIPTQRGINRAGRPEAERLTALGRRNRHY